MVEILKSEYGGSPNNFHVEKRGPELHVELTYPPRSDAENKNDQVRYVCFDQESVRASDGIRIHYDYHRDGYVIEQPRERFIKKSENSYDGATDWIEVGFFQAWACDSPADNQTDDEYLNEKFARAEAEYNIKREPLD